MKYEDIRKKLELIEFKTWQQIGRQAAWKLDEKNIEDGDEIMKFFVNEYNKLYATKTQHNIITDQEISNILRKEKIKKLNGFR